MKVPLVLPRIAVTLLVLLCSCVDQTVAPQDPNVLTWTYYTKATGLPSDGILSLYEDKLGKIWIGTNLGAASYDGISFSIYNESQGLVDNSVNAITQSANGDIFFGTNNGVGLLRNGALLYFPSLLGVVVNTLLTDTTNIIWMGTESYGILKYDGSSITQTFDNNCPACNSVNTLYQDSGNQIWIGTEGGVKLFKAGTYQLFTGSNGLTGTNIRSVTEDSWGNVWMGTKDDLKVNKYKNGKFEPVSLSTNSLYTANWVFGMQADHLGQLWIGTYGDGLIRYDGIAMRKEFYGPPELFITTLLKDQHGDIWVGTDERGIGRFTPKKSVNP